MTTDKRAAEKITPGKINNSQFDTGAVVSSTLAGWSLQAAATNKPIAGSHSRSDKVEVDPRLFNAMWQSAFQQGKNSVHEDPILIAERTKQNDRFFDTLQKMVRGTAAATHPNSREPTPAPASTSLLERTAEAILKTGLPIGELANPQVYPTLDCAGICDLFREQKLSPIEQALVRAAVSKRREPRFDPDQP